MIYILKSFLIIFFGSVKQTDLLLDGRPLVVDVAVLEVEGRVVEGRVVLVQQQPVLRLTDCLDRIDG